MDSLAAADALRQWALDEELKERVMSSPPLAALASKIARRYTAGESIDDALAATRRSAVRGHRASVEYVGESVRDADIAVAETDIIVELSHRLSETGVPTTVSLDLSHIGSVVDPQLGLDNARRILDALAPHGATMMISAEGSDRTDTTLEMYESLSETHSGVGITIQARLHRTRTDLARVLDCPGPIRLVKGAFHETSDHALTREDDALHSAYRHFADEIIAAGHELSIATHDQTLIDAILADSTLSGSSSVEFEMLLGLGTIALDELAAKNYRTREYSVFGTEWWLYVLNRLAEDPERLFAALVDVNGPDVAHELGRRQ